MLVYACMRVVVFPGACAVGSKESRQVGKVELQKARDMESSDAVAGPKMSPSKRKRATATEPVAQEAERTSVPTVSELHRVATGTVVQMADLWLLWADAAVRNVPVHGRPIPVYSCIAADATGFVTLVLWREKATEAGKTLGSAWAAAQAQGRMHTRAWRWITFAWRSRD